MFRPLICRHQLDYSLYKNYNYVRKRLLFTEVTYDGHIKITISKPNNIEINK